VYTEETEPLEVPRGGFARDVLDIEGYVRGFHRRRPGVDPTVLRFAPFVGAHVDTGLTRYLAQPVVPTVLGRDPRLQFVHIDDVFEVLVRSVVEAHPGTFNVAGPGTLTLSQAIRRAGRIGAPIVESALNAGTALARGADLAAFTLDRLDLLVHGRVVDTSRLVDGFGYQPRSTAAAFDDFVSARRGGGALGPDSVRAAEKLVLERIRQVRGTHGDSV
jgi:UDP-glucose 4-epimerase